MSEEPKVENLVNGVTKYGNSQDRRIKKEKLCRTVFLNRQTAARYRNLISILHA